MAAVADNAVAGVRHLGAVAKEIVQRTGDLAQANAAVREAAAAPRPPIDTSAQAQGLKRALEGASEPLRKLLDPELAQTDEGRAWLAQVARAVKDKGGPDWTDAPHEIPARLRAALGDPNLVDGLRDLERDVQRSAPIAGDDEGSSGG